MGKHDEIVIVGTGETADIAYEYFTYDSPYDVVGFSAESRFLTEDKKEGLPVVPFENLAHYYDPRSVAAFVAISYTQLNRLRTRLFHTVRAQGYDCPTYVSSQAVVWRNATIGANCFVGQHSSIDPQARVGDNVFIRPGVLVGHGSVVHENCYLSPHVALAGNCEIGDSSFLGINSCVGDERKVAHDCIIGAGAVVVRDTEPRNVYVGNPARATGADSFDTFGVPQVG